MSLVLADVRDRETVYQGQVMAHARGGQHARANDDAVRAYPARHALEGESAVSQWTPDPLVKEKQADERKAKGRSGKREIELRLASRTTRTSHTGSGHGCPFLVPDSHRRYLE